MRFGEHAATAKERAERMLCCPSRDALAATISKTGANSWVSAAQHGAECGVQFVARSEQGGGEATGAGCEGRMSGTRTPLLCISVGLCRWGVAVLGQRTPRDDGVTHVENLSGKVKGICMSGKALHR